MRRGSSFTVLLLVFSAGVARAEVPLPAYPECGLTEEYFADNAKFHGARVDSIIVDGDQAAVVWWMDMEMGGNRFQRTQVAVQSWKDGQIVKETFYYAP